MCCGVVVVSLTARFSCAGGAEGLTHTPAAAGTFAQAFLLFNRGRALLRLSFRCTQMIHDTTKPLCAHTHNLHTPTHRASFYYTHAHTLTCHPAHHDALEEEGLEEMDQHDLHELHVDNQHNHHNHGAQHHQQQQHSPSFLSSACSGSMSSSAGTSTGLTPNQAAGSYGAYVLEQVRW